MKKTDDLIRDHKRAVERIAKIGAPEPHFRPTSFGELTTVTVKTTIGHQASPSATNYWEDEAFDEALAMVIRSEFETLAGKALARMKEAADNALVSEEEVLRKRLATIESIKSGGAA